ncbi:MAG: carboxypeptidase regulatory-like domain-containing protein, partial [Armatimonadetes bacterium]|nr:carboxypeptidase regulatory-like domain-containing protein [Armatimonadota bacterium]
TIETDSGVRRTTVTNSGGIFKFDELPVGGATLTVEPMDPQLERESLRIYFGAEQRMIANVGVNDRNIVAVVESLEISMPSGTVVAPGSRTPFVVRVSGQNVQSLIPSIWVDGGIGSLGAGNQFIASVPGTGKIRVRVLGREAELNVTVQ